MVIISGHTGGGNSARLSSARLSNVLSFPDLPPLSLAGSSKQLSRIIRIGYGLFAKSVEIIPDETVVVDRSLDVSEFQRKFGYTPARFEERVVQSSVVKRQVYLDTHIFGVNM
jgi:hypothetical protein